jgi:hypothetical protein
VLLTCGKGGWGGTYPLFKQNFLNKTASAAALLSGLVGVYNEGIFTLELLTIICSTANLKVKKQ